MKREYTVLYQPIEDGWIMATVPELPGAVTQGRNLSEVQGLAHITRYRKLQNDSSGG